MSLASGVLLGADVVTGYVNPTGFQTAREQGTSTEKIFLTVGHEYKNNNYSVVSGAVLKPVGFTYPVTTSAASNTPEAKLIITSEI